MKKYLLIALALVLLCFTFVSCDYFGRFHDDTFTITFDTDGGSKIAEQRVLKDEPIVEPEDPTKDGYVFAGWYLEDSKWDFSSTVTESITLKAKWNVLTYNVNFVDEDGTLISTQAVEHGGKIQKPADPNKDGSIFIGWYVGDEAWSFIGYSVTEDITLTARWNSLTYTIRFVNENGVLLCSQNAQYGDKITEPKEPSKSGYAFDGWYNNGTKWDFNAPVTSSLDLTASWVKVHEVVCQTADFVFRTSVVTGTTISEPIPPSVSGWTFEGWYNGNTKWNFNTPITDDISLVGRWSAPVRYELDGGTNSYNNPTVIYSGDRYPIQLSDPTKEGYIFAGWYTDYSSALNSIDFFSSHTFYAMWISSDSPYPWGKTDIIICINEDSDSRQLPSTSRRYLAGDLSGYENDQAQVDDYVADRNADAEKVTNVKAKYLYLPDGASYGWSQSIYFIDELVKSGDPETPDVFVNFVYDMVASSLRGNFANLYSTTMYEDGHQYAGTDYNYFAFEDDRAYEDTGEDYMYEYMRSLTLSKWKMYCLASDYFIDAIRASMVVPVNIELLEMITPSNVEGEFNYDSNENGKYDINDFYDLVWNMDWTYETLADFSEAIVQEQGGDANITIADRVGFALGTGWGLPASGMLYSTSITIVNRTFDLATSDYTYNYSNTKDVAPGQFEFNDKSEDATFEQLDVFCKNLSELVNTNGVITVSVDEARAAGFSGDPEAIRRNFANGKILFGGVIVLGALEHEDYLGMKGAGKKGYGIAPVPLYHSEGGDDYLTQIHNNGKIGAIAFSTQKFAQCTAYLNYQSTNSNKVLNEYYDYKLKATVQVLDAAGNVEMLQYIRYNVRSSFDKAFEDALGEFYKAQTSGNSENDKWHTMIKNANFSLTDMRTQYATVVGVKADRLYNLENSIYPTLPD